MVTRLVTIEDEMGADIANPAAAAGVTPGDVVLEMNAVPVFTMRDMKAANKKGSKTLQLRVVRREADDDALGGGAADDVTAIVSDVVTDDIDDPELSALLRMHGAGDFQDHLGSGPHTAGDDDEAAGLAAATALGDAIDGVGSQAALDQMVEAMVMGGRRGGFANGW